jgi:hypothetical protein
MILPSLFSALVQVFQLPSILLFDFELAIFTLLEQSVGASRTCRLVLEFTVVEIRCPPLFNGLVYRIDLDAADCAPHRVPPSSKRILWKNAFHAKKNACFASKNGKEY